MARIKKKAHEKLDDKNISHVISLLEKESPITKKEACSILNISYNTQRLNKIIQEYKDQKEYEDRRRKENRNKPVDTFDKKYIVEHYLKDVSITELSNTLFRGISQIRKVLVEYNIPVRSGKHDYTKPSLLPEEGVKKDILPGEIAWSAKYGCVVEVLRKVENQNRLDGPVYSVWIMGKYNQFGYQPWYDLGVMPKLAELGLSTAQLSVSNDINLEYSIG